MAVVTRPNATKVPDIRKGDTVVAIVGKDAGKAGVAVIMKPIFAAAKAPDVPTALAIAAMVKVVPLIRVAVAKSARSTS